MVLLAIKNVHLELCFRKYQMRTVNPLSRGEVGKAREKKHTIFRNIYNIKDFKRYHRNHHYHLRSRVFSAMQRVLFHLTVGCVAVGFSFDKFGLNLNNDNDLD